MTNDRTVSVFAKDFFQLDPIAAYGVSPSLEVGLAGICLQPDHGYVFVTFAYQDAAGILRNNVVRFQSKPEVFSTAPESQIAFTQVFAADESHPSHQIGHCQTQGDYLYVSVGDGEQPFEGQRLDTTLGKVLRLTLDGDPVPENPFYEAAEPDRPANYIWAYGFRNPFGLKIAQDRFFVSENGTDVDKFMEIEEGRNHLWNGSDRSIATNAAFLQSPGTGVVQVDFYTGDSGALPPRNEGKFFMVISGNPIALKKDSPPQVLVFDYGFEENRLLSVPETFLRYRGKHNQVLAGVQTGPDGLYIVPLLPDPSGRSAIFKIQPAPGHRHSLVLGEDAAPHILLREKSCLGCHTIDDKTGGRIGPELNRQLLEQRLNPRLDSAVYLQELDRVDSLNREPFNAFKAARQELREKTGRTG